MERVFPPMFFVLIGSLCSICFTLISLSEAVRIPPSPCSALTGAGWRPPRHPPPPRGLLSLPRSFSFWSKGVWVSSLTFLKQRARGKGELRKVQDLLKPQTEASPDKKSK